MSGGAAQEVASGVFVAFTGLVGTELLGGMWTASDHLALLIVFVLYELAVAVVAMAMAADGHDPAVTFGGGGAFTRAWRMLGHILVFMVTQNAIERAEHALLHESILLGIVVVSCALPFSRGFDAIFGRTLAVLDTVLSALAFYYSDVLLARVTDSARHPVNLYAVVLLVAAVLGFTWLGRRGGERGPVSSLVSQIAFLLVVRWLVYIYQSHMVQSVSPRTGLLFLAIFFVTGDTLLDHMGHTDLSQTVLSTLVLYTSGALFAEDLSRRGGPTHCFLSVAVGVWFLLCWLRPRIERYTGPREHYLFELATHTASYLVVQGSFPYAREYVRGAKNIFTRLVVYMLLVLFASHLVWRGRERRD
jgi:hypothetical protein